MEGGGGRDGEMERIREMEIGDAFSDGEGINHRTSQELGTLSPQSVVAEMSRNRATPRSL
jgi:hypothetical protein